jgi:hypothetical protein
MLERFIMLCQVDWHLRELDLTIFKQSSVWFEWILKRMFPLGLCVWCPRAFAGTSSQNCLPQCAYSHSSSTKNSRSNSMCPQMPAESRIVTLCLQMPAGTYSTHASSHTPRATPSGPLVCRTRWPRSHLGIRPLPSPLIAGSGTSRGYYWI